MNLCEPRFPCVAFITDPADLVQRDRTMNAIDRADFDARGVASTEARFCDDVSDDCLL